MMHPPSITESSYNDMLNYCGAMIDVVDPAGHTTSGMVADICQECGGEGGLDLMLANYEDILKDYVPHGNCTNGASWTITGWAKLLPGAKN
jgi:hypothetical protein